MRLALFFYFLALCVPLIYSQMSPEDYYVQPLPPESCEQIDEVRLVFDEDSLTLFICNFTDTTITHLGYLGYMLSYCEVLDGQGSWVPVYHQFGCGTGLEYNPVPSCSYSFGRSRVRLKDYLGYKLEPFQTKVRICVRTEQDPICTTEFDMEVDKFLLLGPFISGYRMRQIRYLKGDIDEFEPFSRYDDELKDLYEQAGLESDFPTTFD
ncbi:MAG: hypothetical protein AAFP08_08515 [Bacteroidota bacterium]